MQRALYVLLGVLLVPAVGLVGDIVTDGKFTSTVSTGAPLEVASDDMVANLNADMVDGVEGTDLYTKAEVDALIAAATTTASRRFYLTASDHVGNTALTACDPGFHMASIWEILDVSNLRYDTTRGVTKDDSGSGPPTADGGWIRTGTIARTNVSPIGGANCDAWTSASGSHHGTAMTLPNNWSDSLPMNSTWRFVAQPCDSEHTNVWCVED
jgi:hypothetical protein